MCLPLLLNLTQFSVVFDLNHPKPHRLRGENPATFLEVKKFRLSCRFCLHTHTHTNRVWYQLKYKWLMAGGQQNRILHHPAGFFQGVSSAEPNPPSQNPSSETPTNDAFGTRGFRKKGFRLNVPPLAAESSFVFVKILLGRPGFRTLAPPKILPTVWTSFREFLPMFCQDFLLGDMPTSRWRVCFQASFLINQLGTFDASDIQRETSFKNVFSVVRGDLRNKSQIGTLDHL